MNKKATEVSRLQGPDRQIHEIFPIPAEAGAGPVRPEAMPETVPVSAGARLRKAPMKNPVRARYPGKILAIKAVPAEIEPREVVMPEPTRDKSLPQTREQLAGTTAINHPEAMVLSTETATATEIVNQYEAIPAKASMLQGHMPSIASIMPLPIGGPYVQIMLRAIIIIRSGTAKSIIITVCQAGSM